MAKYIVLILICVLCSLSCSSVKQEGMMNEKMDIYLVIGQSNMAGRAQISKEHEGPIEGVFLFKENEKDPWQVAANPLNKYSTIRKKIGMQRLGPSYSFAKSMREATPDRQLGLVVNAKGGTGIVQWLPGTHFFKEAVIRTKAAMRYGKLKGIIWHQGESDSDEIRIELYLGRVEEMVNGFREAFEDANLPFVAGEVYEIDRRIPINNILRKIPGFIKHSGLASSEGTSTSDNTHFDAASAILLGERYAENMLKLQGQLEKGGK